MRFAATALTVIAFFGPASAHAGPPAKGGLLDRLTAPASRFSPEDEAIVRRANVALNAIKTMKGNFQQISEQGFSRGTFYLSRPGKLRFEYDNAPILFVVDGSWVSVDDKKLKVVNRYPLDSTPLRFLLKNEVDLARDTIVTLIERLPGQVRISLRDATNLSQGELTLVFNEASFDLEQWIVVDAQGTRTTIRLQNVETGMVLLPKLFVVVDYGYEGR